VLLLNFKNSFENLLPKLSMTITFETYNIMIRRRLFLTYTYLSTMKINSKQFNMLSWSNATIESHKLTGLWSCLNSNIFIRLISKLLHQKNYRANLNYIEQVTKQKFASQHCTLRELSTIVNFLIERFVKKKIFSARRFHHFVVRVIRIFLKW